MSNFSRLNNISSFLFVLYSNLQAEWGGKRGGSLWISNFLWTVCVSCDSLFQTSLSEALLTLSGVLGKHARFVTKSIRTPGYYRYMWLLLKLGPLRLEAHSCIGCFLCCRITVFFQWSSEAQTCTRMMMPGYTMGQKDTVLRFEWQNSCGTPRSMTSAPVTLLRWTGMLSDPQDPPQEGKKEKTNKKKPH